MSRNTTTERLCPHCKGAGEIPFNNSYNRDPQCDDAHLCGDCNGRGWISFMPPDPLVLLGIYRARRSSLPHARYYQNMRDVLRRRSYLPDRKPRDFLDAGILAIAKAQVI